MKIVDEAITTLINMSTGIPLEDIYNYYDLNGVMPQKIGSDIEGNKTLIPYEPTDSFVVFGTEERSEGQSGVMYQEDKIILLNSLLVKVEFNGIKADSLAYKMKALIWSDACREYLDNKNITITSLNPSIESTNESVGEELWIRRGIEFNITIELWYNNSSEVFEELGEWEIKNIEEVKNGQ